MSDFWRGFLACMATTSLYQDFLGKEEYLRRVQTGWVDGAITIPIAVVILVAALTFPHKGGA